MPSEIHNHAIPKSSAMRSLATLTISTLRSGVHLRQRVIRTSRLSIAGRVRLHVLHLLLIAGLSLALLIR